MFSSLLREQHMGHAWCATPGPSAHMDLEVEHLRNPTTTKEPEEPSHYASMGFAPNEQVVDFRIVRETSDAESDQPPPTV